MTAGADPFTRPFLIGHARRYPLWEAADLYKLLYQAVRGSEHAALDTAAAGDRLAWELSRLGPGPAEPLVDPIRADGALARVHLRPWQGAGLDPGVLLGAFVETARTWRETPGELETALERAAGGAGELGLEPGMVAALAARMKEQGYPAAHHSPAYSRLYRPAYRVVATRLLPAEVLALGLPRAR